MGLMLRRNFSEDASDAEHDADSLIFENRLSTSYTWGFGRSIYD